ncbi:hypothetical protein K501DRAFT_278349 [Backusella circina FSU 941]|nr:hypothetical protein K501DRAFT_278349 [Backusella circina FSU 941]
MLSTFYINYDAFLSQFPERDAAAKDNNSLNLDGVFFCTKSWHNKHSRKCSKGNRLLANVDIFSKKLMLIPINQSYHWTLGAIDMDKKCIRVYDSLNGNHDKIIQKLWDYLESEHQDKKQLPFDHTG